MNRAFLMHMLTKASLSARSAASASAALRRPHPAKATHSTSAGSRRTGTAGSVNLMVVVVLR